MDKEKRKLRRRKSNGSDIGRAVPLDAPLEQKVEAILQQFMFINAQFVELRKAVAAPRIEAIAREQYKKEEERLGKLRDDCVKLLGLMVEKGRLTHEEIAEALDD